MKTSYDFSEGMRLVRSVGSKLSLVMVLVLLVIRQRRGCRPYGVLNGFVPSPNAGTSSSPAGAYQPRVRVFHPHSYDLMLVVVGS